MLYLPTLVNQFYSNLTENRGFSFQLNAGYHFIEP